MNKLLGVFERIIKPAIFCYDFRNHRAGLSYASSRCWVFLWLTLEIGTQLLLESGSEQGTASWLGAALWLGTAGTFVLLWKLPPVLGATLAGAGVFRATLSLSLFLGAQAGSLSPYLPNILLAIQVWMLSAYCVLVLRYLRTAKKDMPAVRWPSRMRVAGGAIVRPWWM